MSRWQRVLLVSLGVLLVAGAGAFAQPLEGVYQMDPCDPLEPPVDPNGQCDPIGVDGSGSSLRAVDTTGFVGFDIVQPVDGEIVFRIDGTDADIIGSAVDIVFSVDLSDLGLGSVDTDVRSRIEGAVGTVVGDQIQWIGTQEFIGNGTIDCNLLFGLCGLSGFAEGLNVIVEGANITPFCTEPPVNAGIPCAQDSDCDAVGGDGICTVETPPNPTTITLPDFDFSAGGSSLLNTGEFSITDTDPPDQLVALEATFIPEPSTTLLLGPGLLALIALDRRRARAVRRRDSGRRPAGG